METKRMNPNIDAELFQGMVRSRDTRALHAGLRFHARYVRMLSAYVKRKLGARERDWEDVLQDVLMATSEHCDRAPLAGVEFRRWVFSIARTICFNLVTRGHDVEPLPLIDPVCLRPGPALQIQLDEQTAHILSSVDALPPNLAELIRLHYLDDISVQELAPRFGLETRVVRSHLEKGRGDLRRKLTAHRGTGRIQKKPRLGARGRHHTKPGSATDSPRGGGKPGPAVL